MEAFILGSLGASYNAVLVLSLTMVIAMRKSIRKKHILTLLAVTIISFIAFFGLLLWGLASYDGQKSVTMFQTVLKFLAALVVGCGSAIGFSFILKSLGLASITDSKESE